MLLWKFLLDPNPHNTTDHILYSFHKTNPSYRVNTAWWPLPKQWTSFIPVLSPLWCSKHVIISFHRLDKAARFTMTSSWHSNVQRLNAGHYSNLFSDYMLCITVYWTWSMQYSLDKYEIDLHIFDTAALKWLVVERDPQTLGKARHMARGRGMRGKKEQKSDVIKFVTRSITLWTRRVLFWNVACGCLVCLS